MSPIFFYTTSSLIGPLPHIYRVNATGRVSEGTETGQDGSTYRFFNPPGATLLIKEV